MGSRYQQNRNDWVFRRSRADYACYAEFKIDEITNALNYITSFEGKYTLGSIDLKTKVDKVELVLDQAIPCGLLVNELITNALKYAFPEDRPGKIFLGLTEKQTQIELEISDDGVGMPEGFSILNSDTLGLQLVNTLVEQLDGEIRVENSGGIKYLITFEKAKI